MNEQLKDLARSFPVPYGFKQIERFDGQFFF